MHIVYVCVRRWGECTSCVGGEGQGCGWLLRSPNHFPINELYAQLGEYLNLDGKSSLYAFEYAWEYASNQTSVRRL